MHESRSGFITLSRRALEIVPQVLPLPVGQFLVPRVSWGIVMRSGIGDRVGHKVVRKIRVVGMAVEGKLENSSTRQLKLVPECRYIRSNNAKIFDDERQAAQLVANCFE